MASSLFTLKRVGSQGITTPDVAIPAHYLEDHQDVHEDARGITEVYLELTERDLERLKAGEQSAVEGSLTKQLVHASADDLVVGVVAISNHSHLDFDALVRFFEIVEDEVDIVTTPLASKNLDKTDLDEEPIVFSRYVENQELFLGALEAADADLEVLGTVPVVEWARARELLVTLDETADDLESTYLRGFCIDFLSKSPGSKSRIRNWMIPFAEYLNVDRLHDERLFYAVNAHRGQAKVGADWKPIENFLSLGIGVDVLGGFYYRTRTGAPIDQDEPHFRCYDDDTYTHYRVPLSELRQHLEAATTGLSVEEILRSVEEWEYRDIQQVWDAEQLALLARRLREAIDREESVRFVTDREGASEIVSGLGDVRRAYEEGGNSTLDEFV